MSRFALTAAVRWLGPFLILIGALAMGFEFFDPRPDRSSFEVGLLYTATEYDVLLPLIGLGCTLAQLPFLLCAAGIAILLASIPAGGVFADWMADTASADNSISLAFYLVGPTCCILVGSALAVPDRIRVMLTPLAAFGVGLALGLGIDFRTSHLEQWSFAAGRIIFGLWLALSVLLSWRAFERPWLRIPARIFGSWLIAIGAMLAAAQVIAPHTPSEEEPVSVTEN